MTIPKFFVICVAATAAVGLALASAPPALSTPVTQPWQSSTCYTGPCEWSPSTGTYVTGGDGTSIEDFVGGSDWGSLAPIQQEAGTIEAIAAEELPVFSTVSSLEFLYLQPVAAFSLGWKIGSTLNNKWFHLAGVGLGSRSGQSSSIQAMRWHHVAAQPTWGVPAGWELEIETSNAYYSSFGNLGSCSQVGSRLWTALNSFNGTAGTLYQEGNWTGCYNGPAYVKLIPDALMPLVLHIDQPLQPYTGQTSSIATGWPNASSGACITTTCSNWNFGPANPPFSIPIFQCEISGDPVYCGSVGPPIPVNPDGTTYFGGAGSTGGGLGSGPQSDLNCIADPADYVCPSVASGGGAYSTSGSAAGEMPDCYGMTVSACEAAVLAVRSDATFVVTTVSLSDPNVAESLVVSTTPTATTDPTPSTVDIAKNPDVGNPEACSWDVQNPHESDGTPGSVDVKAVVKCNYETIVVGTLRLWKCDDLPSADLPSLNSGDWGCAETAGTVVDDERLVTPSKSATFQVPPPGSGITIAPDGKYYIAWGEVDVVGAEFSNPVGPLS